MRKCRLLPPLGSISRHKTMVNYTSAAPKCRPSAAPGGRWRQFGATDGTFTLPPLPHQSAAPANAPPRQRTAPVDVSRALPYSRGERALEPLGSEFLVPDSSAVTPSNDPLNYLGSFNASGFSFNKTTFSGGGLGSGPTGTSTSSTMHISVPNFAGYGVDTGAYEVFDFSLAGFDANGFDAEGYTRSRRPLAPVLEDVPLLPPPPPSSMPAPRDEETTIILPPLPAIAIPSSTTLSSSTPAQPRRSTRARKRADSPPPTVPNPTKKTRKRAAALDLEIDG
ncbi:hypothetical protein GGX14DRAFT_673484 [Mycena pura]|uniref:Uncharacterized protein n=1 Tax=Mycena pura TaxID=153505 RepID=A0AAD6Y6C0_9AGAR|nr:hypothetical protein GGX14DRAFT_673484 [Mycena pura]